MSDAEFKMSVGRVATLACLLEVTAPKPGNVHRGADFEGLTFSDFLISAVVVGEVFDRVGLSTGELILEAIGATHNSVRTNTNLGIVLLLAPLVTVLGSGAEHGPLRQANVRKCLNELSVEDGEKVYAAIQLAKPGGMGDASSNDVKDVAGPVDLLAAMRSSQGRDAIARQYANGFEDVFGLGQRLLRKGRELFIDLNEAIVFSHVAWMAEQADTLIQRKCGKEVAGHAQILAQKAVIAIDSKKLGIGERLSKMDAEPFWGRVGELDFWLRSDGHRRNPGATADLIAATLFVAIWNGDLRPPFQSI